MISTHLNPRLITCMLVCALTTGCSDADAENAAREVLSDGSEVVTYRSRPDGPHATVSSRKQTAADAPSSSRNFAPSASARWRYSTRLVSSPIAAASVVALSVR